MPITKEIAGTVKAVLWKDPYAVGVNHIFVVETEDGEEYKLFGSVPAVSAGDRIRASIYLDYKQRWMVNTLDFVVEYNSYTLHRLLTMIKGIGNKTALRILNEVKKIREKRGLPMLFSTLQEFVDELKSANVDPKIAKRVEEHFRQLEVTDKLHKIFGSKINYKEAVEMADRLISSGLVEQFDFNPYIIVDVYPEVRLHLLDEYMRRIYNIDPASPSRLDAYVKKEMYDLGSSRKISIVDEHMLVNKVLRKVASSGVKITNVAASVKRLLDNGWMFRTDTNALIITSVYEKASYIASALLERESTAKRLSTDKIPRFIEMYENATGKKLTDQQKEAVMFAFEEPVLIVSGSAGTGKSTVTDLIYRIATSLGLTVKILTPTGKAASRYNGIAKTIHLEIRWNGTEATKDTAADIFIIDEASMVDLDILYEFLRHSNKEAHIVFVGDHYQLPPVGYASPFHEIIASGIFKHIELDTVFRQEGSLLDFIHAIRVYDRGKLAYIINSKLYRDEDPVPDLSIVPVKLEQLPALVEKLTEKLKQRFTMLVPVRQPHITMSSSYINSIAVRTLTKLGEKAFKVICTENDYSRQVFNGDIGTMYGMEDGEYVVFFDGVKHTYSEIERLRYLDYAYALTVHKAQGSEYDTAFVLLFSDHVKYYDRRMLYTAVSRAKKKLFLITDMNVMETIDAIEQKKNYERPEEFGIIANMLKSHIEVIT